MNKMLLTATLMGSVICAKGQAPRPHASEIGVEGASYAAVAVPTRPRFQPLAGVVFRYVPRRLGLRLGIDFSRQVSPADASNCADCLSGETTFRTLTLRAGGQYAVLPQATWLYTFLDLAYRTTSAAGEYRGGLCGCLNITAKETTSAGGAMAGVGARWRLLPRLYFSPELYYEGFVGRTAGSSIDNRTGQITTTSGHWATQHTPAARLQATVSF